MNKIDIKTRRTLLWAIFLSVGFPLGIAMTVIGFMKGQSFRAMGIVGIILIVMGFYCAPLVWIHFGQLKYFSRLKAQIVGDGIKSVKMLAEVHNKNPEVVANDVKTMVQKGYLDGYLVLDNERIIDKTTMRDKDYEMMEAERAGTLNLVHCPFCNAKFALINDVGVCPYCNSKITKEMLDKSVKAYNKSDK